MFTEKKELFEKYGVALKLAGDNQPAPVRVDGGRIHPGRISFGRNAHDLGAKSMFDREAQGGVFSAPNPFNWAILSLQGDRDNVNAKNTFVREFQNACQRSGLAVNEPVMQECGRNAHQWLEHMRNLRNADFLLLVVPARGRKKDDMNL